MPRKKKPTHEGFESIEPHGKFVKITKNMMDSRAWKELTPSQWGLYLHLKSKYTKYKSGDDNRLDISMPRSEYIQMKTYTNQRTFWRDLDALIDKGFIAVISRGRTTRTPNIYGFSVKWQKYGNPDFKILDKHRRLVK